MIRATTDETRIDTTEQVGQPEVHQPKVSQPKAVQPLDITVLAGGVGAERAVSLESGKMVRDALRRLDHQAIMLDIHPEDLTALDVPADVVFIALHGAFGEDGDLQRILEQRNVVFTGCDSTASALAMDKIRTKNILIENGIPTPEFQAVLPAAAPCHDWLPCVVKPRGSGSSVDVFIAKNATELDQALDQVVTQHGEALVERYVSGPELTVSVLDGTALPVCEIRTAREFYDYKAKYHDDDTQYLFDLDLPESLLARIQELSVRAFEVLGCRDFARMDWMVDRETLEPYFIEANTIPGLTSHSLLPKAAARAGVSFESLCQKVIELAVQRSGW